MTKKITEDGEVLDMVTHEVVAMAPPFWKTPFNHDTSDVSKSLAQINTHPSKTQQQFAKEADINVILAKFLNTGELPATGAPNYMNVDQEFDLQEQIVTRAQVEEAWSKLPANVRNMLRDPKTLIEYVDHCRSTGDLEPLRELGLVDPLPAPPAPPEPPKPPTPAAPPVAAPAGKAPQGPQ